MDIKKELKNKFKQIKNVFYEKEGSLYFLRVEVNLKSLDQISILSREISEYLDKIDYSNEEYYLDVYSSGTDKVLSIDELKEFLNENVLVNLKVKVKEMHQFEGELLEVNNYSIIVKWNAKGQIRKQEILKENIKEIKLYAKAK